MMYAIWWGDRKGREEGGGRREKGGRGECKLSESL